MWKPSRPLNELSNYIRPYYVEHADFLFCDLCYTRLEVVLVPAPDKMFEGHMIREVVNANPDWYKDLYSSVANLRRELSLKALDRLRRQHDRPVNSRSSRTPYTYDSRYRTLIHNNLLKGFNSVDGFVPPNNEVRSFFGLEVVVIDSFSEEEFI